MVPMRRGPRGRRVRRLVRGVFSLVGRALMVAGVLTCITVGLWIALDHEIEFERVGLHFSVSS